MTETSVKIATGFDVCNQTGWPGATGFIVACIALAAVAWAIAWCNK